MYKYLLLLLTPITSLAQLSQIDEVNTHLDIRPFISLQVTVGTQDLNYDFNSINVIETGITKSNAFLVSIKSNQNWQLNISSLSPTFIDAQSTMASTLPSTSLSLKKGNGLFIPLNTMQTNIATGGRGGSNNPGNNFGLDLKANIDFNQKSGQYMLDVAFTITAD